MISLYYNTENYYRICGINHFIQKYGVQLCFNTESEINMIYGNAPKDINGFNIYIRENEIGNGTFGYLKTDGRKVPLFEELIRLDEYGESLVMFVDNKGNEYPGVVLDNNGIAVSFDVFNEIGHILTGYLEHLWKSKLDDSIQKRFARMPMVDYYEKILFECLLLASDRLDIELKYKPFWPDGKKFAVCLTHDVDRVHKTYQYLTHFFKYIQSKNLLTAFNQIASVSEKLRGNDPYWNFGKVMEIERELGVKSTFFFLNEQRKTWLLPPCEWKLYWGRYNIKDAKIIEAIRKLDAEGWEIGIHGSYNSYRDLKMLEDEKNVLEGILDKNVYGISQHYCNLNIPKTWKYHEKLGLEYDSTIGFISDITFRCGTCFPFHPFDTVEGTTLSLWTLPITIVDNACSSNRENIWNEILNAVNSVEICHGLLVLRWHQEAFNDEPPHDRSEIYKRIIALCIKNGAWVTNAKEIVEWWDLREEKTELLDFPKHSLEISYSCIVVTPCKNEAHNLPRLIESMLSQTMKPVLWVIIDDSSTDGTFEIISDAEKKYNWVKGIRVGAISNKRDRGIHLANVIKRGFDFAVKYSMENGIKFDYLSNVDGDIVLEPAFFEKVVGEFKNDPRLGVASGITRYIFDGTIVDETGDENEPPGGHMVIRRECYEECNGIPLSYAVDSVLKAKARLNGWKTKKFNAIAIEERPVHSAEGYWKGYAEKGEAAYYLNLSPLHIMFNTMHYLFKRPYYIGISYFARYFDCLIRKNGRIEDEELRRYFRNKWKDKLVGKLKLRLARPD